MEMKIIDLKKVSITTSKGGVKHKYYAYEEGNDEPIYVSALTHRNYIAICLKDFGVNTKFITDWRRMFAFGRLDLVFKGASRHFYRSYLYDIKYESAEKSGVVLAVLPEYKVELMHRYGNLDEIEEATMIKQLMRQFYKLSEIWIKQGVINDDDNMARVAQIENWRVRLKSHSTPVDGKRLVEYQIISK